MTLEKEMCALCHQAPLWILLIIACMTMPPSSQDCWAETVILQSWHGDFPVASLDLLPEDQRDHGTGFIAEAGSFERIWEAFKPGQALPKIDFSTHLVLFARNTHFYNRIRIGRVKVKNRVGEVVAMETMSAIPIEDRVAMSMVQVSRAGISSLRTAQGVIEISGDQEIHPDSDSLTQAGPRTFVFECPNGYEFTARIEGQTAWLFLPGQTVSLPQVPSASGAQYSHGRITFWNKGDEARLEIGEDSHQKCVNNRARAIWEHAKLNGVDFRAVGNEPGWHLELKRGGKILLVTDYGQSRYVFDTPRPQEDRETGITTYRVQNQEQDLEIQLQIRPCRDSMSGELFETTVTVKLDGRTFQGCGRALH